MLPQDWAKIKKTLHLSCGKLSCYFFVAVQGVSWLLHGPCLVWGSQHFVPCLWPLLRRVCQHLLRANYPIESLLTTYERRLKLITTIILCQSRSSGVSLVFQVFQETWRSNMENLSIYWNATLPCPLMASIYANL